MHLDKNRSTIFFVFCGCPQHHVVPNFSGLYFKVDRIDGFIGSGAVHLTKSLYCSSVVSDCALDRTALKLYCTELVLAKLC